jgi:hypothetical protein
MGCEISALQYLDDVEFIYTVEVTCEKRKKKGEDNFDSRRIIVAD